MHVVEMVLVAYTKTGCIRNFLALDAKMQFTDYYDDCSCRVIMAAAGTSFSISVGKGD